MLIIIYGVAGAGKTYVGTLLQRKFGCYFWDADDALTPEMIACIKEKRPFEQSMREEYLQILQTRIRLLVNTVPNDRPIVVSQALYQSNARKQLMETFKDACFIQVVAEDNILFQRLQKRNDGIDSDYLMKIKSHFEPPDQEEMPKTIILKNNRTEEEALITTLKKLPLLQGIDLKEK